MYSIQFYDPKFSGLNRNEDTEEKLIETLAFYLAMGYIKLNSEMTLEKLPRGFKSKEKAYKEFITKNKLENISFLNACVIL